MKTDGIYHLETLTEIIETALFTASVREEIPISLILVGPSGSAKSKLLRAYKCDQIHVTDSITSAGLWEIVQRDIKNEKNFILIPDINPTLSRRTSTTTATVGNLLSLTGDGTVRIDDGRGDKVCKHLPMGVITACTPEIYHRHARQWFSLGLTRRIIPVFYSYTSTTLDSLQKLVREDHIHASFGLEHEFKLPPVARPLINSVGTFEFQTKSSDFAINLGKIQFIQEGMKKWQHRNIVPVSPHVTLRTLAMAHALRRRSMKVEQPEIDFISTFVSFTDPENPRQL
jgi:hypothetical protein